MTSEHDDPNLPTDNVRKLRTVAQEAVIVLRIQLDDPDTLSRIIADVEKIDGVTTIWGWAAVDQSARAILAVCQTGIVDPEVEEVTKLFHDTYEKLAPQFSYTTREASAKPWSEVPENNQQLMRATVATVLAALGR